MNPDQPSREEIEARLTALLLGELPAEEAALLRYTMAQDPALQSLHDELASAVGLVREAAKHPAAEEGSKSAPLKLSAERRRILLAHFRTPRGKAEPLFWLRPIGPSLVPVLVAIAVIAVLAALLMPSLAAAKRKAQRNAVQHDYMQMSLQTDSVRSRARAAAASPAVVTVAPEPPLATPPAPMAGPAAAPIVLPSAQPESGQLADNVGETTRTVITVSQSAAAVSANDGLAASPTAPPPASEAQPQVATEPVALAMNRPRRALTDSGLPDRSMEAAPSQAETGKSGGKYDGFNEDQAKTPTDRKPGEVVVDQRLAMRTRSEQSEDQWKVPSVVQDSENSSGNRNAAGNDQGSGPAPGILNGLAYSGLAGSSGGGGGGAVGSVAGALPAQRPQTVTASGGTLSWNDTSMKGSRAENVQLGAPQSAPSGVFPGVSAYSDIHSTMPTPTMDALTLQTIYQNRGDGQKQYNEQAVQLQELKSIVQELKSIAKTNKDKLADMLPTMVQDSELNGLLNERNQARQNLVILSNDYSISSSIVAPAQTHVDELNHRINDRLDGIMAGLESQVASKKAALDAMSASVEAAKEKAEEERAKNQPYYDAKRDLEQKEKTHEQLYAKLESEKVDLILPKTSMVQITDEAQPAHSQSLWQRLTGQYESTARIKLENDVNDIASLSGQRAATSFDPYFVQTTFEIIRSDLVLSNVVAEQKLQSKWAKDNGGEALNTAQAIAQLRQRIDLHPVPNTKLIEIGVKSDNPSEAADLANAVAKAYRDYRFASRQRLTTNGVTVLNEQFAQQEKDIQLARAKVARLAQEAPAEPAAEPVDVPLRKPAPETPVPQPEILTRSNNFSTFSLNVSDVSFKLAEASLQNGKLPDTASIRSEEFINAFDYRDPEAAPGQPMAFTSERARYPFAQNRELLRFAVKTAATGRTAGRALNLVLLLDISGSMERADRVAIIREALRVLATQLQPQDTVSVVTFARTARLWADGVRGDQAGETLERVGGITPEGGTNLEEAMRLAYETAHRHYLAGGMNRVVLLTDGAANLGNVDPGALKQKVDAQRQQGIALDCFGIGWEDYNDDLLERLSSNGGGRYAFLNSPEEAAKDFAAKLAGALEITAADVKVQVEFNPQRVISYRQIGYAKHQLTKEQFRDNTVAAGEIAAQEAGNALYTIETNPNGEGPVATVHVRYRVPGTDDYREHSWEVAYPGMAPALERSSAAMRLAATAGAFSEWLAASPYAQEVTLDALLNQLSGVPGVYGADDRPKQLEMMIREAKSLEGK